MNYLSPNLGRTVVFDTNIYRGKLARENKRPRSHEEIRSYVADVRRRERAAGIVAAVSPHMLMELVSHLTSESPASTRSNCLCALLAASLHAQDSGVEPSTVRMLPDVRTLWCRALFGPQPPGYPWETEKLRCVCINMCEDPAKLELASMKVLIREIRDKHKSAEREFLADAVRTIRVVDPSATDVQFFPKDKQKRQGLLNWWRSEAGEHHLAKILIRHYAALLEIRLPDPALDEKARAVRTAMLPAIRFYRSMCERLVANPLDESDPKGRFQNNLVDYHLLLSTGPAAGIDGKPILLVSEEVAMREAGRNSTGDDPVLYFDEYLACLPL